MINLTKAKVDEITSLLDKSGWNKAAEIIRSQYSAVEALKACYDQDKVMIESLHKSLEAACREIAYLRARPADELPVAWRVQRSDGEYETSISSNEPTNIKS